MKQIFLSTFLLFVIGSAVYGQKKTIHTIEQTVDKFNKAMVEADGPELFDMTYPSLKYAHSSGVVQNQQEFVEGITSGRSDFVSIKLTQQTVDLVGNTATVRHILTAETFDNKVTGTVRLAVLLVWAKKHGKWRLLARQAVKPAQ